MASGWKLQVVVALSSLLTFVLGQADPPSGEIHRRFEYKYSFKPPYLAQKDGSVPFFEYAGSEFGPF
jgi:hypothetical protein